MQNISIFVSTLGSGGAEKQAALLAKVLSPHYKVHFVVLYGDSEKSKAVENILIKAHVGIYFLRGSWTKRMREYIKILKQNKVVYSFNYLTQCDFWGAIMERFCGVKYVYNGIRSAHLEGYKTVLERISHNFVASGTVFNCQSGANNFMSKGFKKYKCVFIPNCFPHIAQEIERHEKGKKILITVGRFVPDKDYETAVITIAELKKFRSDFVFHIVGYGVLEKDIRNWIEEYKVSDVVKLFIKPNNIPELLNEADIYLSTSLFEGTSNSIMEAMNASLPVVATNVGDNYQLVIHEDNGMLHACGDVTGMADSLSRLMENLDLRNYMGIRGNQILHERYSEEIFEKRYLELIQGSWKSF